MQEERAEAIDERLVMALAHPVRIQILEVLSERVASPNMLAADLETGLTHVAYHTRVLDRCGCLELVRTAQRRGATEHFYKAREDTTFSWMPLDLDEQAWREVISILRETRRRVLTAQEESRRRATAPSHSARRISAVVALAKLEAGRPEAADGAG
jgi:DNA-binding transcriptional ArsR family regulator